MACKHPMVRYEFPNGDYRIMSLEKVINQGIKPVEIQNKKGQIPIKEQQIPCGRCIACRLNYSACWANRLCLELKNIPDEEKWFLTLTYDDQHLHTTKGVDPETGEIYTSNRLEMRDIQLFLKRLRRHDAENITHHTYTDEKGNEKEIGLRYFYCGEYGEKTQRAHYHMVVWNLKLDKTKLQKFHKNEIGQQLWKCPEIEEYWKQGHVVAGQVSWESIAYTARYMLKKQKGEGSELYYQLKGEIPEFCSMSRDPGIAREYYEAHKDEIYKYDEIAIMKKNGAFKIKPPRYFDQLYDIEHPEELEAIKEHRQEIAKEVRKTKLAKTTLTELEQLAVEERSIKKQTEKLVRTLD